MDNSTSDSVRDNVSDILFGRMNSKSVLYSSSKEIASLKIHKRIPSSKALIPSRIPRPKFANKLTKPKTSLISRDGNADNMNMSMSLTSLAQYTDFSKTLMNVSHDMDCDNNLSRLFEDSFENVKTDQKKDEQYQTVASTKESLISGKYIVSHFGGVKKKKVMSTNKHKTINELNLKSTKNSSNNSRQKTFRARRESGTSSTSDLHFSTTKNNNVSDKKCQCHKSR